MYNICKKIDYTKEISNILKEKKIKKNDLNPDTYMYYIQTFGCKGNESDSEIIAGILEECGYVQTDMPSNADIIIFNTCCIRENAENTLFGKLGEVKKYAQKGAIIGIGGCMMQEESAREKVKKSFPFVKLVFGTHTFQNLAKNIYHLLTKNTKIFDVLDIDGEIYEGLPIKRSSNKTASVTIMYGCNNFCTYCIVPYVRGRERSRKPQNIINEVEKLVKDGYIEVTLIGQNVNSYKGDSEIQNFAQLLDRVAKIKGLQKVRFVSPHPKDFTDDVIETIAKNSNISRTLHYPLQSGSTNILKKMNRKYTKEKYLERAEKILEQVPDISFSTDIIVGFPGETEEDFEDTLDVVRKLKFEQIFMFIYSPRKGTPASLMEQVPEEIAQKRFNRLKELYEKQIEEINDKYIGKVEEIIVEGISKNNEDMLSGKTDSNKTVVFEKYDGWKIGDIIKVKITENRKWYFKAEIQR